MFEIQYVVPRGGAWPQSACATVDEVTAAHTPRTAALAIDRVPTWDTPVSQIGCWQNCAASAEAIARGPAGVALAEGGAL